MSENLNRSNPDFSKYDSMSIGELEEILRADAQGPERDDSDVDEILYVMEVLAKKRRQNGTAGKTALEAYQEFQQHYLPMVEEESKPRRKSNVIPFRRIAAVAACLVLVFSLSITANAFSFRDVWDAVVTWAQETFSFSMGVEVSEPNTTDCFEYSSIRDALDANGLNPEIAPTWVPDGYKLVDLIVDKNPMQETYLAVYSKDDSRLKITIQSFVSVRPEQMESNKNVIEIYNSNGINYYILQNNQLTQAAWIIDNYECYIAGEVNISEIKSIIDSIQKG